MSQDREPPMPECPTDRVPHPLRVKRINAMLRENQTGAIAIDDTPIHQAWYLHEVAKYPTLQVVDQGVAMPGVYVIKVRKLTPQS